MNTIIERLSEVASPGERLDLRLGSGHVVDIEAIYNLDLQAAQITPFNNQTIQ